MATQAQANAFADNPVDFLKKNIMTWRGAGPAAQANINVAMQDLDATGRRKGTFGKTNADRFLLRHDFPGNGQVDPGTASFPAVWSGYVAGAAVTANLPAAGGPNIMLTPELTGCAVVCRSNADGSAQFSHYNLVAGTSTLDKAGMALQAVGDYGGGETVFAKEDYRALGKHTEAVTVTAIGFRRNGVWEFWAQVRENKASGQQLRSVRRLNP